MILFDVILRLEENYHVIISNRQDYAWCAKQFLKGVELKFEIKNRRLTNYEFTSAKQFK